MSIVAAFQPTLPSTDRGRLRAALAAVGRRLAASPLDHTVLQAAALPTGGRRTALRADWRTVTAPDGTTRLEASWHAGR
ncbi:hypothetical protein ABTZ03_14520 [Kitasatospora sp. NPDC096077]|uniref:hypothetical protein n=1 Tax=unclassified Kitasatospora TaxID=2633591 RepID=UPI003327048E